MGRLTGRALVGVLVAAAMLGGACLAQSIGDIEPVVESPVTPAPSVALPDTTSDDVATAEEGPSPTSPPPATDAGAVGDPGGSSADAGPAANPADEPSVTPPDDDPAADDADVAAAVVLPPGVEAALAEAFGSRTLVPQPSMARGDLNGDGSDDLVLHVVEETAGPESTDLIVAVIDTGEAFDVRPPTVLGHRILVDTIDIRNGGIEVSYFDRSRYEPLTQVTRRTTLTVEVDGEHADVTVTWVEPVHSVPSLQITRPPVPAAFGLDGFGTAVSDRIEVRERHPVDGHASEGDIVVATLEAPTGVWLEARLGDGSVSVPIAEQTQRFASRMPASGAWRVTVTSSLIEPADYRLSIEVFGPDLGERIATRDPSGFWSGTHMSPPALPDDGPVVYLTFDDGPHPTYTPRILDVLARHGVQATFFVVGYLAERNPSIVQRIAHEGHTLANHSWSHESLARVSRAAFDRSIERTQDVLGPLATPCLRPPYWALGASTEQWAADLGLRLVGWSYSPQDWLGPPANTIANGLVDRSKPGAVILLHDGGGHRATTVRGLDMALERLADSDIEFKAICR